MLHRAATQFVLGITLLFGMQPLGAQSRPDSVVGPASGIEFDDTVTERLLVRRVGPDSPAASARLRSGDVVLTMDQRTFVTPAEVEAYLAGHGTQPVHFMVLRDGERLHVVYVGDYADPDAHRIPHPKYGQAAGIGIRVAGGRPVVIVAVYKNSPADSAGILPGDQLLAVNDVAYARVPDVSAAIAQHPAGEEVRLTIRRDGADRVITVTPEEWARAFDEPPDVLPGWESRYRRCGCYVWTDDFAMDDDARRERDRYAGRDAFADELTDLRDEIRKLRQELNETNSRLDNLPSKRAAD